MKDEIPTGLPMRSGVLVATALVVTGALLGGLLGFAIAASRNTALLPTTLLGVALFTAPAVVATVLWIRSGALGVPTRTPYLPGDRFHGWTVATHRKDTRFDEYEVRRGHRAAHLTVAVPMANGGARWSPTANWSLLSVRSRHLAKPLQSGVARTRPYLLIDHVDGQPLTGLLNAHASPAFTYEVAVSVMSALRDVHAHATVHGAVHTDNVLVGDHGVLLCAFDRSHLASADTIVVPSVGDDIVGWAETVLAVSTGRPFVGAFGEQVTPDDLAAFPEWIRPVVADALAPVPSADAILRDLMRSAAANGISAGRACVPRPASPPLPTVVRRATAVGATTVAAAVVLLVAAPKAPPSPIAVLPTATSTTQPITTPTTTPPTDTTTTTTTTITTTSTTAVDVPPPAQLRWTMPDLAGSNLQAAQDRIQADTSGAVFFTSSHDASGAGRHQTLDANWHVCTQNVPPGAYITPISKIDFGVVKIGESCP